MQPLTPEQKEYIDLKFATERFYEAYTKLKKKGKICPCQNFDTEERVPNVKFKFEQMLYKYLEILQIDWEIEKKQMEGADNADPVKVDIP